MNQTNPIADQDTMVPASPEVIAAVNAKFNTALTHHQAGRLIDAEPLYREIIAIMPGHADAVHLLGVIADHTGRSNEAVTLIRRAIAINPGVSFFYSHLGNAYRNLGRFEEAVNAYRRAVALDPSRADLYNNLGNGLKDLKRYDEAIEQYKLCLEKDPAYATAYNNLANVYNDVGKTDEALVCFEKALALNPDFAEALNGLGSHLFESGSLDEAVPYFQRALALKPRYAAAHNNLANVFMRQSRYDEAEASYRAALAIEPRYIVALNNLSGALRAQKRFDEARAAAAQALQLDSAYADAHNALANVDKDQGRYDAAIDGYKRAIAIAPDAPGAHSNLGNAYLDLGRFDEAEACYERALALKPDFAEAHCNIGSALFCLRRPQDGIAHCEKALALKPDYAGAHGNLAMNLLLAGDLKRGYAEYEWRWKLADTVPVPDIGLPVWKGEDVKGKGVLVLAEQGFGDSLQFVRLVKTLADSAARVDLVVPKPLVRLFSSIPGITAHAEYPNAQGLDYVVPLMSLPHRLGLTLETIPGETPYFSADPADVTRWAERIKPYADSLKIGLVWAGDSRRHQMSAHVIDRRRSLALAQLAPLVGAVPSARFFSLQKGEPAAEAKTPPVGMGLIDWTDDFGDFADTAALIQNLDLVISVDTSVAHLAGGLGKPVWILSRYDGCWRWLLDRDDSPWYPTARLFRQTSPGDWDSIVRTMAEALKVL